MANFFYQILEMSLRGSYVILILLLARLLLRRAPRRILSLLWLVAFFRLICPVSLSAIFSLMPSGETLTPPQTLLNSVLWTGNAAQSTAQGYLGISQTRVTLMSILPVIWLIGAAGILVLLFVRFPDRVVLPDEEGKKYGFLNAAKNPAFPLFVLIFGFYFIAEHSIMNWFVQISTDAYSLTVNQASTYLALFFGGIMVGRLVFAPVIHKIGIKGSILLFGGVALVLYCAGILIGKVALPVLVVSGLSFSILYPTLVMLIQNYYPVGGITTATGLIISTATLFDIGWNAAYGVLIDQLGARGALLLLPAAMALFYLCCVLLARIPQTSYVAK